MRAVSSIECTLSTVLGVVLKAVLPYITVTNLAVFCSVLYLWATGEWIKPESPFNAAGKDVHLQELEICKLTRCQTR